MLARELAEPYPVVDLDSDAFAAARLLAERRLPGLIVNDDHGRPWTILPGSASTALRRPGYVQDDPALARVYDDGMQTSCFDRWRLAACASCFPASRRN